MSVPGNGSEQSMEEILASIRNLISQEAEPQSPANTPAPTMPQTAPQRQNGEPVPANAGSADQNPVSPLASQSPAAMRAGSPASPSTVVRHDDDDLADLLDEPLDPVDLRPAPVEASPDPMALPSQSAPGAVGAGTGADTPATPAAEIKFDFGSLVPSRDSGAPAQGGNVIPGRSRSLEATLSAASVAAGALAAGHVPTEPHPERHSPTGYVPTRQFPTGLTTPAKPPADSLSLGWPNSMRSGQTGPANDRPAATPANSAPKPADAPADMAGQSFRMPAPQQSPRSSEEFANPGTTESLFAPPKSGPDLSSAADNLASVARGEVQVAHAPVQESGTSQSVSGGGEPSQGFASPVSRGPEAASPTATGAADAAASFPSIEPVLKAFERSVPQAVTSQAEQQSPVPRGKVEFGAKPLSSGFGLTDPPKPVSVPAPSAAVKAASETTSAQPAAGGRTLEDAVMELLRPMLREWLDENLPRIIEKAVQREVADTIKSKVDPA